MEQHFFIKRNTHCKTIDLSFSLYFVIELFNKIVDYSAKDFDSWLIPKLQVKSLEERPSFEAALVLERLKADRFTTDNAIRAVVNSFAETDREDFITILVTKKLKSSE